MFRNQTAGLCSHVGQVVLRGEPSCLNLCLSGGYKKTRGFEAVIRALSAQQPRNTVRAEQKNPDFSLCPFARQWGGVHVGYILCDI